MLKPGAPFFFLSAHLLHWAMPPHSLTADRGPRGVAETKVQLAKEMKKQGIAIAMPKP